MMPQKHNKQENSCVYIAFEGIDGSGKSTQCKKLADYLVKEYGKRSVAIWQYNGSNNIFGRLMERLYEKPGCRWRRLVSHRWIREAIYGLSARQSVKTSSAQAQILLSDRSVVTSYALHRNELPDWFVTWVEPRRYPNLIIYLDLEPSDSIERILRRGLPLRSGETVEKLTRLRRNYQAVLNERRPPPLLAAETILIDASLEEDRVTDQIVGSVRTWLLGHLRQSIVSP